MYLTSKIKIRYTFLKNNKMMGEIRHIRVKGGFNEQYSTIRK